MSSAARLIVAVTAAALVPAGAHGQNRDDRERLEVDLVTLDGVDSLDAGPLRKVLATQASTWLPWARPRYFDPDQFQLDLRRIVAYYRDHGFPDVAVVSHDVQVDEGNRKVDVTVRIEEGAPVLVEDIVFKGLDVLQPDRIDALRVSLAVGVGDVAVRQRLRQGVEQTAEALENQGFAYAAVRLERAAIAPTQLRVRYVAEPGPRVFFGPIEVAGNESVDDGIVRRQLAYRPGELFRLDAVRESQQKIYGLELFLFSY